MSRHPSASGPGPGWRPDADPTDRPQQGPAPTGLPDGGTAPDPFDPSTDLHRHGQPLPQNDARHEQDALSSPVATPGPRRRDRRGRGLRNPLLPRHVPAWRSRSARFDDRVLDAVERLERRWSAELDGVEIAVEDVPPSDPAPWEDDEVPLGRLFPSQGDVPARIVVYRRPVETRATDEEDLGPLVHDVVVEQVAHLLQIPPEQVDPRYRSDS